MNRNEVIIVAIETRHDLEGDPVPVAIDFERNEYICNWETLEKGGLDTGWIKQMKQAQYGARSGVTFKAVDLGGEIASVVPIDPDAPQKKRGYDPITFWRWFSGFPSPWETNND